MTWVSFTAKRDLIFKSISKLFLKLPEVTFSSAVSDALEGIFLQFYLRAG